MRSLHTVTRRDDLLDFLTPVPQINLSTQVLNEIRWEGGASFAALAPLFTMPGPVQDFSDPALTPSQRSSLSPIPYPKQYRVTINPSTYGLDGTKTFWLRRIVRIDGVDTVEPGLYMMAPRLPTERPTHVIAGTAPALASVANSLQLELPSSMTSVAISVSSGSNLAIAFDRRDQEQIIATGTPEYVFSGTVSTLFIRGVGGGSDFQIVVSRAYSLLP